MSGSGEDEVLSIADSEKSFSGFSPLSEDEVPEKRKTKGKKVKSVVKKVTAPKEKVKKPKIVENQKSRGDDGSAKLLPKDKGGHVPLDISKLSQTDIENLREALGIKPTFEYAEEDDFSNVFGSVENLPNIRVELDRNDISDNDEPRRPNMQQAFSKALFDENQSIEEEDDTWGLPQLKAPLKGAPVSKSLASMINVACTSQCDVDSLVQKYRIPENCEKACPPLVNGEIWKVMDKRTQSQDRGIVETQNLVSSGITPIIKLAEMLKPQINGIPEAKGLISDALTLLGQVQYNLSIRRRYMIRPALKKKYHTLCNISTPISTKLFGDDVAKDIKACDSMASIGKEQGYRNFPMRGRGNGRFSRRGFPNSQSYGNSARYQPYPVRGQYRYPVRNPGYKIPKKSATATATAPNEQM